MNTTEIIYEIARRTKRTSRSVTRDEVSLVIDLLLDILIEELTKPSGRIYLRNIGLLYVKTIRYPGGLLKKGQSATQIRDKEKKLLHRLKLQTSRSLLKQLREIE